MKKKFISFIITLTLIISLISINSLAWYIGYVGIKTDSSEIKLGANTSYFESGDGSKSHPYIISQARHLYNLAWLQDLGYYDDYDTSTSEIEPYYFRLKNNIDMNDLTFNSVKSPIPCIGIDEHPFISNFDGNGYKIDNLFVTTDFTSESYIKPSRNVLNNHTETCTNNILNTSYTGLFGYIGSKSLGQTLESKVSNFVLSNATINPTINTLMGYICGYADNDIENIGVANSCFKIEANVGPINNYDYLSMYSLIGDYDNDNGAIGWIDKPKSGETGYGTSTDLKELYDNLGGEGAAITKGEAFPFKATSSTKISPSASKINMTLSSGVKQVTAATTQNVVSTGNNLGYYAGSDIKVYKKTQVNYSKFYYPQDSANSYELPATINGVTYNAPSEDIVNYLTEIQGTAPDTYSNGQYLMRMTGSSQLDIQNEGGLYAVENASVGSWSGTLLIPNRCVWVAPVRSGKFKFVLMNVDKSSMGFRLYKLTRSTPKNYSTHFTNSSYPLEFNNLLLPGKAYYFEVDVTDEDIDSGYEYALSAGDGYNPYLAYIDIGVSGSDVASVGSISNLDYVYEDNSTNSGYNSINEDTISGVGFRFEGVASSTSYFYVYRSILIGVQYVDLTNGLTVTAYGNSSTKRDSIDDFS